MPHVQANDIEVYYEVQGEGEPLVLIPYLAADQACYAFQVADYAKRFTCYTVDLRGAGLTSKPEGNYSTELFADDVAAFMRAVGISRAHVSGLSLGAATGMWLAAKHPELVKSLSLHSGWTATDPYLRVVVQGWQTMAKALGSTTDMVIQGIFPWCFTPELYASKPEYIESLAGFVRSRPMPPVDAFLRQSDAVLAHDVTGALNLIQAPTQITFGQFDAATSVRFAGPLTEAIDGAELVIFEGCAHAPIYENVAEFNARTMDFLTRNSLRSPSLGGERAVGEPGASGRAERERAVGEPGASGEPSASERPGNPERAGEPSVRYLTAAGAGTRTGPVSFGHETGPRGKIVDSSTT